MLGLEPGQIACCFLCCLPEYSEQLGLLLEEQLLQLPDSEMVAGLLVAPLDSWSDSGDFAVTGF